MAFSENDIVKMRKAGEMTGKALKYAESLIGPGISTKYLDKKIYQYIINMGGQPNFLDYDGYPASICASVNEVVVHGIPSEDIILKEGDIISVDLGVMYKGFNGDAARTFAVGKISPEKQRLIDVTKQCFYEGLKQVKVGAHVGDIGQAVQTYAEENGYSVVRELVGHGIGRDMHMDPQVPNYGTKGHGPVLEANMAIAIEPMINMGKKNIYLKSDGWTVYTKDGLPSAHYENTVLITPTTVEILTNEL